MEVNPYGGYFVGMSDIQNPVANVMSAIVTQVQDLIHMATYETQTDVASTLAHWTASIVSGEIRDASLSVFATTDPDTGEVVDRIISPTNLRLVVTLSDGRTLEEQATLYPSSHPYLVNMRPS